MFNTTEYQYLILSNKQLLLVNSFFLSNQCLLLLELKTNYIRKLF